MHAEQTSLSLPTHLQTLVCFSPSLPNAGTPIHSVILSKFFEWCGFTALCLCLVPSSPPGMSFNFVCCLKMPTHLSGPRSTLISHKSHVSKWAAHYSLFCVPLPLIGWRSSPLCPRIHEPCLTFLGSNFPHLPGSDREKALKIEWKNIGVPFHIHQISKLLES